MVGNASSLQEPGAGMTDDDGIIKELLDEAENERMHLMTFIEISKPTLFERLLVLVLRLFSEPFIFSYTYSSEEQLIE